MGNKLKLQIVTPKRIILEKEIDSITAPSKSGEITVLPHHTSLFTLLHEGVVTVRGEGDETAFSIGGGYLETDGDHVNVLVSRAYGQDELDEKDIEEAMREAERRVKEAPTDEARHEAMEMLRRSTIDLKVLRKKKAPR